MAAALLAWWLMDAPVLAFRLLVFCAVPIIVVVVSWILRRAWQIRPDWDIPDAPPEFTAPDVSAIRFTGHALALTALTVGGIGLIRSYLSVVALGPAITGVARGPAILFLVLGVAGVVLPWVISWALAAGAAERCRDPLASVGSRAPASLFGRWVLLGVVLALFLLIAVLPGRLRPPRRLGGRRRLAHPADRHPGHGGSADPGAAHGRGVPDPGVPPHPSGQRAGDRHRPRRSDGGRQHHPPGDRLSGRPDPQRPAVSGLVQTWLNQPDACEVEVNGQRVRPMIMVAAEGGGIRAAYWTVKGLAAIDSGTGGCGAHSTLFSGGASGGSVGLTVARFSGTPTTPAPSGRWTRSRPWPNRRPWGRR